MQEQKDLVRGMTYGFIAVFLFSFTTPFTKIAIEGFSPYFVAAGRVAVAGIIAAGIMFVQKQRWPKKIYWSRIIAVSLGTSVGFPLCLSIALTQTDASHAGIVLAILPLLTSLIGAWINHEKHSAKFWLMAISGSLTVLVYIIWRNGIKFSVADFWLLAASLSAATAYAVGASLSRHIGGVNTICWSAIFMLPFSIPTAIYLLNYVEILPAIPARSLIAFLYLATISQLIGFIPWYTGLRLGGIARVSQIQLLQIFLTLFEAAILLGETVPWHCWAVAAIVVAQIYMTKKFA